jgi:hypothetical protein
MIVCERCLSKDCSEVYVRFMKKDKGKKSERQMLGVKYHFCEQCINDALKSFGRFFKEFLKDGDTEEIIKEQS